MRTLWFYPNKSQILTTNWPESGKNSSSTWVVLYSLPFYCVFLLLCLISHVLTHMFSRSISLDSFLVSFTPTVCLCSLLRIPHPPLSLSDTDRIILLYQGRLHVWRHQRTLPCCRIHTLLDLGFLNCKESPVLLPHMRLTAPAICYHLCLTPTSKIIYCA